MPRMINDQLAREIQLDRPPTSLSERVFRVCLGVMIALGLIGAALRLIFSEDRVEEMSGTGGLVAGIVFVACLLYVINYAAWRYCPTRWIRWTWFVLEGFLIFALLMAKLTTP